MVFPPPPVSSIDWKKIGFESKPFNGHVESRYTVSTGSWSAPQLVADPFLRVHGLAPAFNYGQQAYEGMKAFRDPSGNINIFRPSDHARRMNHSSSFVSIPAMPEAHFKACVQLAVGANAAFVPPHDADAALYIRPVVFGASAHLPLTPPQEYLFAVYVQPLNAYHGSAAADALVLEDFDRTAPKGTGAAKVGGNYAPVIRWSEKAKKEGFGITLHLDSRTNTEIDEFSTSGFIGVQARDDARGGYRLVVPDSKNVIRSVTSVSCIELARSFGWDVETRSIKYEELASFDEVIAVGTAAALVPIRSITLLLGLAARNCSKLYRISSVV
ncbi:Branched-chain-amino-acid aminotransferase TOXF [Lasiodiplodia theobromae]|uniref:Branched-chain-amino-acid aminotransferase TOXF n=1 Tax=Lasiodiplodia theobromae TaxID=45133 RepID=UPI0015C30B79|nr:Branched-chain-amino-acid aminotransferase TOXF [Lasiodiplodia theobromae]KAF4539220.1 Branched-chain-amino-acid aminotransferase TOXF [Lasiodiplodia theobromae]